MKKYSFLTVALCTVLISSGVSAYSVKTTTEIQSFFNSTSGSTQEKLRDSINALNFHASRLQAELNSTPTSTKPGMLIPFTGAIPANGVISASSSPVLGLQFFATGTPMVIDNVRLRISVKKGGVQENPASVISNIIVTGGTGSINIPVTSSSLIRATTSSSGEVVYYVDIKDPKITVPSGAGVAKQMLISAVFNPVETSREISVSVYGSQGIKATSELGVSTYYTLPEGRTYTYSFNPNSRRGTPVMPPTTATSGQAAPLLKTSFFGNFVKNLQAQVLYMFGK